MIAERKRGPSNLRRRLDGTILGIRRLGNLSVPFRLSPVVGVAQSSMGSHPHGGCDEIRFWRKDLVCRLIRKGAFRTVSCARGAISGCLMDG